MSAIEDKAVSMLDQFTQALSDLAVKYGPDVVDATLAVVQLNGLQQLIFTILQLAVSIGLIWLGCWGWAKRTEAVAAKIAKCKYDDMHNDITDTNYIVPAVVGWVLGCAIFISFINWVSSIWMWVAIFEPKLWLAHSLLSKFIK